MGTNLQKIWLELTLILCATKNSDNSYHRYEVIRVLSSGYLCHQLHIFHVPNGDISVQSANCDNGHVGAARDCGDDRRLAQLDQDFVRLQRNQRKCAWILPIKMTVFVVWMRFKLSDLKKWNWPSWAATPTQCKWGVAIRQVMRFLAKTSKVKIFLPVLMLNISSSPKSFETRTRKIVIEGRVFVGLFAAKWSK